MKAYVGAGWHIAHITDRVVELRKDSYEYRRFVGRDGYVRVRAEPGMDRTTMMAKAVKLAQENDEKLALRIAKQMLPSRQSLAEYTGKQVKFAPVFSTPEDPERIGVKRA